MNIKKIISSLTYEKQMFVKLMTLVTIPLVVMGLVSCNIYIRGESAKNRLTLSSYSDEISREYENILSSLKEYYIETANSDEFLWLVRQEEVPYSLYSNLKRAQRSLEGNYFMAKYIDSYEFINVNQGWVFNNYGLFSFEDMRNLDETEKIIEEQKEIPLSVYWLNNTDTKAPMTGSMRVTNTVDTSGLRLMVKGEKGIGGISWLLTVRINESKLRSLSAGYPTRDFDITIIGNGKVFLETNSDMTDTYLAHKEEGAGIYKSNSGKKYNISTKQEGSSGLTYVVGYDTAKVKKDGWVFVMASFAVIAAFAVLLLIVRVTAMAFAKPLLMLEKYVDDQNHQIKELLVSNLIKGDLSEEKIEEELKKSAIQPWTAYRMIALNCKNDGEGETKDNYVRILAGMPEELRNEIFIAPIHYRDKLIVLVGAESDTEVDNKTAYLYKTIKDYIGETFGYAIATGISQPFHKLHHVRRAFSECAQALYNKSNQEDMETSSLALFDDYLVMSHSSNVYDMIMENELIQSISSCKEEEATRLLELIIDRMEIKGVVGIQWNFYLTRLLTAILNVPVSAGVSLDHVFDSEQYNVLNQMTQIYDKKKLLSAVSSNMIHPIVVKLTARNQEGGESELAVQLMEMIRDSRGNVSLNDCADKLSYHPNYLSKVLKREKGITFTDMINEEKLKLAKYMLLTTDYTVAEISEELQYNNVQNFIRFFKKQVDSTPAAFRKEHRK